MNSIDTIRRVTRFDGHGLPVVSMYLGVPVGTSPRAVKSKATALIEQLRAGTRDPSLPHEAKTSLRTDLEHLERTLTEQPPRPGTAALFSCAGAGLFEQVRLPRAVHDRVVTDATPYVRPMVAVLDEYHKSCIVVVDRERAQIWELYLDDLTEATHLRDPAPRKPDYGGWHGLDEHRVRNRAEEKAHAHYRSVAEAVDRLVRTDALELLIIGGHKEELAGFVSFLPRALRERVAGTFTIDPRTATTADIRRHAQAIVERYERDEERRWVAEVLDTAAAGGLATVGLENCLWAGSVVAVQRLLVQNDEAARGVVCTASDWLGLSGDSCPICGAPTRATDDVVDELVEFVIDDGGTVEHVQAETPLAERLVAASLRFPLPPQPSSTNRT